MSENTPDSAAEPVAGSAQAEPQLQILTQYVKDLSFENPNAPQSLQPGAAPAIEMEIGVGVVLAQEGVYEVALNISINAMRDKNTLFLVELVYCGLFAIQNIPEESLAPVLHIECTRLIFPYARRIVADLTQDGGFPALPLEPIDFAAVYRAGLEQQAAQQGATPEKPQSNGADGDSGKA